MTQDGRAHVVILGAGFGGLEAAKALARADVRVTVVDKRNHHLFQPLLYQVATAALAPTDIAAPIRTILAHQENVTVRLARATAIDPKNKVVHLDASGEALAYDVLIVAAGLTNAYFGHDAWERNAPGLKSLEEALRIRDHVLLAYERAELAGEEERARLLTFVVIGGGPTGVELAGALAEIARKTMTRNFRHFDPKSARVVLLEGGARLLASYPPELSARASADLEEIGVEVRVGVRASDIDEGGVSIGDERIEARTVLWAAGVGGVPIARTLGVPLDRMGRVPVRPDLRPEGIDDVFVIGDLASCKGEDGNPLPGVAQVALQQGRHAAKGARRVLAGQPLEPFRYKDLGSMATIGRKRAIAVLGRIQLEGLLAWLAWLFVHVMALVGFRNRVAVLAEWAWAYLTYQRSARVILDRAAPRTSAPPP